jgi:hypothetical protein
MALTAESERSRAWSPEELGTDGDLQHLRCLCVPGHRLCQPTHTICVRCLCRDGVSRGKRPNNNQQWIVRYEPSKGRPGTVSQCRALQVRQICSTKTESTNWRSGQLSVRFLPRIKDQGLMRDSDAGKAIMNRDSLSGTILYRVREFPGERLSRTHSPGQRLSHCEILGWFLPPSQGLGYPSRTDVGKSAWQPNVVVWRLHIRTANKHGSAPTSAVRMAPPPHDAL